MWAISPDAKYENNASLQRCALSDLAALTVLHLQSHNCQLITAPLAVSRVCCQLTRLSYLTHFDNISSSTWFWSKQLLIGNQEVREVKLVAHGKNVTKLQNPNAFAILRITACSSFFITFIYWLIQGQCEYFPDNLRFHKCAHLKKSSWKSLLICWF